MDANGWSRRKFVLQSTGVAAAALVTSRDEHAHARSADSSDLLDYERYDGLALAELVRKRQVTAHELLEMARQRVEQRNPATNAIVIPMYHEAETTISAGLPAGPFTGVPYVLKDLGALYAGAITSSGSNAFRNLVADHDSEVVTRLKRAGLVIFGKTHSSEFGLSTSSDRGCLASREIHGIPSTAQAARAEVRQRPSLLESLPWPTPPTAAARSAYPPAAAVCSG